VSSGLELRPIVLALKEWGDRRREPGKQPVGRGELTVTGGTHPIVGEPW
jgi:hypothetical protein